MVDYKVCPKCKRAMRVGNYSGAVVSWKKGEEQTFLKHTGRKIVTYACEGCRFMESYVT